MTSRDRSHGMMARPPPCLCENARAGKTLARARWDDGRRRAWTETVTGEDGCMPAVDVEEALRARWCEDGGGPEAEEAMRRAVMANARAHRCDEGARAREESGRWDRMETS